MFHWSLHLSVLHVPLPRHVIRAERIETPKSVLRVQPVQLTYLRACIPSQVVRGMVAISPFVGFREGESLGCQLPHPNNSSDMTELGGEDDFGGGFGE